MPALQSLKFSQSCLIKMLKGYRESMLPCRSSNTTDSLRYPAPSFQVVLGENTLSLSRKDTMLNVQTKSSKLFVIEHSPAYPWKDSGYHNQRLVIICSGHSFGKVHIFIDNAVPWLYQPVPVLKQIVGQTIRADMENLSMRVDPDPTSCGHFII